MARHRIAASTWHERVAHWRSTGLLAVACCCDHEIGVEHLKCWVRRADRAVSSPQLLLMRISAPSTAAALELRGPPVWSMHMDACVDTAWLARLLRELR